METRKHTDPERLRIFAAKLNLWLLDLLLWLSEWMGRALPRVFRISMRADIRRALHGARLVVFMLAVARCDPPPGEAHGRHPGAPRGFRRAGVLDNDLRNVCRTVRLRGRTIAARLAEVRDVLDNLDAWVARARKRLRAGGHGARLMLCFVVAERLRQLTAQAPALADSS